MTAAPFDQDHAEEIPDFSRATRWCFGATGFGSAIMTGLLVSHLVRAAGADADSIGVAMLAAGALHLLPAVGQRHTGTPILWSISGLFYMMAAVMTLLTPAASTYLLTLVIALMLGVSGLARLVIGIQERAQWVLFSGCASVLCGTVIGMDSPRNALWMVGSLIACDMAFQTVAFCLTALCHRFAVVEDDN